MGDCDLVCRESEKVDLFKSRVHERGILTIKKKNSMKMEKYHTCFVGSFNGCPMDNYSTHCFLRVVDCIIIYSAQRTVFNRTNHGFILTK